MRELTACWAVFVVAACGGGTSNEIIDAGPDAFEDTTPDARQPDFGCAATPEPTAAADPVIVAGTAGDVNIATMSLDPLEGATIRAVRNSDQAELASATSAADGTFALSIVTGGAPVDAYLEGSLADHRALRLYTPQPLSASVAEIPSLLISNDTFGILVAVANADQTPGNGSMVLAATDCAGQPLGDAEFSVKAGDTELITQDNSFPASGILFVFDLPPGEVVVSGTSGGHALRAHTVEIVADTNTATSVAPGFIALP